MKPSRRLLFVLYEATFGGVERQAELLAEAAKQAGYGVTLLILGGEGPALPRFRPFCDVIRVLNAPLSRDFGLHRCVRVAVAGEAYAAAFLFSTARFSVISHALREAAPKQVLNVGNPVSPSAGERWKQTLRAWLFPPATGLHLVANSNHTLRSLQAHPFYRRFPLHVSPNCVRVPAEASRVESGTFRLGMVARLDPIKDHATLLEALARLPAGERAVECELVGGGVLEPELKSQAATLRLVERGLVRFCGWVEDVGAHLNRWDLFVFSTTAQEGFGNAAAEAMAYGLPCIFTDVGPCREVGGDAVVYVPPKDPGALAATITTLRDDPDRRRQLGALAYERALVHFQPSRNLADFLAAIGEARPVAVPA